MGAKLSRLARLDPDSLHERFTYLFLFVCLFIIFCPLFALNFRVYTTIAGEGGTWGVGKRNTFHH